MIVLVTGASGLVGGAVVRAATRAGHEVTGLVGRFAGALPGGARRIALDLTGLAAVETAVLSAAPAVIVNAAAVSEPAQCEADPARSQALNVDLPADLAGLAARLGAVLVHFSSEQVYDGTRAPYAVGDPVNPINLYARQKLASEARVLAAAPSRAVVLRIPLLMGNSPGGRRSVHERLFADWAQNRIPRLYTDEIRQTCTADSVAAAALAVAGRHDLRGIFNWAGAEPLSRFELGRRLRAHFRLREAVAPLVAVSRRDDPAATITRQADLSMDLAPLAGALPVRPQTFAEQLAELAVPPPWQAWYAEHRGSPDD